MSLIPRLKSALDASDMMAAFSPGKTSVPEFESAFAQKFGCAEGVMFSHGRTALYALLKVWGLESAEVICPAYTCVVVQNAIVLSGNVPVFVDCAQGSPNMSYEGIAEAITDKTRAVVVTHLFGYPMDVDRVASIIQDAEKKFGHKIYIIQDAAHSYGASYKGKLVTSEGDAAIFGMNISKIMTSIFGGMATSNDPKTIAALRTYRTEHFKKGGLARALKKLAYLMAIRVAFNKYIYSFTHWLESKGVLDRFTVYFDESLIEFPEDWKEIPTALEARVGMSQLRRYDQFIEARRKKSLEVKAGLKSNADIEFFPHEEGCTYSHCVGRVEDRAAWERDYLASGVQLGILIEYAVPYMKAFEKYRRGEYPIAKDYSEHMVNFPIWPGVPNYTLQ